MSRFATWGMSITYRYDHNGMRVGKTVNGVETHYTLNGSTLTHMASGGDALHFFYDGNGMPTLVEYNGARYAYLHNLQGDVVGLLDSTGALVVEYSYDAWGKPTGVTGSLAGTLGKVNPLRYRGYVWDEETGLYYLQSRYYNPTWGRFISADNVLGKAGALFSHNLYAYCTNNPVFLKDSKGAEAVSAAVGVVATSQLDGPLPIVDLIAVCYCGGRLIQAWSETNSTDTSVLPEPGFAPPVLPATTPSPRNASQPKYNIGAAYTYGPGKNKPPHTPSSLNAYTLKEMVELLQRKGGDGIKEAVRGTIDYAADVFGVICDNIGDAEALVKALSLRVKSYDVYGVIMKHLHIDDVRYIFLHIWFH